MHRATIIFFLAVILTALSVSAEAFDDKNKRPAVTPPEVTIVSVDAAGLTAHVDADWKISLAEALAGVDGATTVDDLIIRASAGLDIASNTFELPRLTSPFLATGGAVFEEVSLGHLPDSLLAKLAIALPSQPLRLVGTGMTQHTPVTTLDARMLVFDASRATIRRYDHVEASVRFGAAASAGTTSASESSPHTLVTRSVLADGTWFKFSVPGEGVFRVDDAFLTALGLSPLAVDPARVRVFGNGGKALPAVNRVERAVDLVEQPVFASHDGDTSFEPGEYVLFYASGLTSWNFSQLLGAWTHELNPFATTNFYFIQTDGPPANAIVTVEHPAFSNPFPVTTFQARHVVDDDLIHLEQDGSGSGLEWFGVIVDREVPQRNILRFEPPGLAAGDVFYTSRVAVRSNPAATIRFESGGSVLASATPGIVNGGNELGAMAREAFLNFSSPVPGNGVLELDLRLVGVSNDPAGWLDWLEVYYPRRLEAADDFLRFHSEPNAAGPFEYRLSGFSAEPQVWDITVNGAAKRLTTVRNGSDWIVQIALNSTSKPIEFIAFTPNSISIQRPSAGESIPRQNLHGITEFPDFVIVTVDELMPVATELAQRRRSEGLTTTIADVREIYNEFSGGLPDMRAVRDYFRFLYDRGHAEGIPLRYALLLGDGHFDFRNITEDSESPLNPNLVLPYETDNTLIKGSSYTSDDYFGLLDPEEGLWQWSGDSHVSFERVDVGIGRWPVANIEEARIVMEKVKLYESDETQGSWRTRYTFVADDSRAGSSLDYDLHTQNADVVAEAVAARFPEINIQKIYTISYPTVTTSNGRRIPDANRDIIAAIEDGTLIWNYSGHGGITGLADERIFTLEDIEELDNGDKLTLFITATCTFGRFDTDRGSSGGERLLIKESGGSVALFTTVRIVVTWVNPNTFNLGLNLELNKHLLRRDETGLALRLGDVIRITKNSNVGLQGNNRKFNLLGDPTMRLALPERDVQITEVNGEAVDSTGILLRSLERVNLSGIVADQSGSIDGNFHGAVEVTVFDAKRSVEIPEEDQRFIASGQYTVQNDLIFRGVVQAESGRFTTEFVVPRDIAFSDLAGRISMYASSPDVDGFGATENVLVGGTADNPVSDVDGPEIELFLNDSTFVSGGLTTPEPLLIVKMTDASGMNTVGTGVGHEMLLVIDGNDQDAIEIGDRYEGRLGSFQEGFVTLRLPEQAVGDHTLSVKAWDVLNNSSDAVLDYTVASAENLALQNIFNYPNPMVGQTRFVFEHNQPAGTPAEIEVRVYTVSGRIVRLMDTIDTLPGGVLPAGPVQIIWDGRDDDLDRISPGIYLYKLKVSVNLPSGERDSVEHIGRLAVVG